MKNKELISSGNPFKAVIIFSLPSILAMLVNAIYNIVDKIFIGNFVSSYALAGLQVVNPLLFLSFSVMVMFGLGTASYASNKLGEGNTKEANKIFNNGLIYGSIIVIIIQILFFIFQNNLLALGGAKEDNFEYASEYYRIIILGFLFQFISYFFTMNLRSEGRPLISMLAQITGCVTNILLDALFIIVFKMGVFGAAFATLLGHLANFMVGLSFYLFSKNKVFSISIKDGLKFNGNIISQISSIGLSSAVLNISSSVSILVFNNVIKDYPNALSILAILSSLDQICILPCVGIRQGILPILGYNYGEKNYKRMFKIWGAGMVYGVIYGLLMCSMIMLFPTIFIDLFVNNESIEIVSEAAKICSYYQIGLIIISSNMNASAFYQATREKGKAVVLSMMRQFLFLVPLLYALDLSFGQSGVWMSTPISDFLSSISAIILFFFTYMRFKKTGYLNKRDLLLDLKENDRRSYT